MSVVENLPKGMIVQVHALQLSFVVRDDIVTTPKGMICPTVLLLIVIYAGAYRRG